MNGLFGAVEKSQGDLLSILKDTNTKYLWVSYLYKSCRIGDARNACIAAELVKHMAGEYYLSLVLNQLVGEDLHPVYHAKLLPNCQAYVDLLGRKINKYHNGVQLTYQIAKSPKWYMDNVMDGLKDSDVYNGMELEAIRQEINVQLEIYDKTKAAKYLLEHTPKLPDWVQDRHTQAGRKKHKTTGEVTPLDGHWDNRYRVKEHWDNVTADMEGFSYEQKLDKYISTFYK